MADSIKLKSAVTLKHQANLGEDLADVEFAAGDELSVLQEWDSAWLVEEQRRQALQREEGPGRTRVISSASVFTRRSGLTGFLKITPSRPSSRLRLMTWSWS